MQWRTSLLLSLLGLALALGVAQFEHFPGYLDSDYYFGGGIQLAQGKGFVEPYLWNYLDDPRGLPHPSHAYWMPLSSLIAAAGMWLTGQTTYNAGRLGFLLLAALVPPLTAALAFSFTARRELALISGLLAVFSIYYVPFLPVTDNYGPYLVLGALYFLSARTGRSASYFVLGVLSGLLMLARSDGLMWIGLTLLLIAYRQFRERKVRLAGFQVLLALAGFLLVIGPWLWRNLGVYGTPLAPGGHYLLWLTNYDQTFVYPASQLTMQAWLAQGAGHILAGYLYALSWNLLNAFAAQGGIFLFPFILLGLWQFRKDERIRLGGLAWLGLFIVMTFIFPYAGARGGFFHSGSAVQPLWWSMAPIGLDGVVAATRRRGWLTPDAFKVFRGALVGIAILMTAVIVYIRVLPGWGEGEQTYPAVEAFLDSHGILPGDVVMVRNPPGYFLMTGRPAIVVPYGDATTMFQVAVRYHAKFLVIEAEGAAGPIKSVYDNESSPQFRFMGELNGTRIFQVQP